MNKKVGMPTTGSIGSAFGSYAVGLLGGGLFGLSQSFFGSGLIGSLIAPVLAASVIKGDAGKILAVTAGYNAFADVFAGLGSVGGGASERGEM